MLEVVVFVMFTLYKLFAKQRCAKNRRCKFPRVTPPSNKLKYSMEKKNTSWLIKVRKKEPKKRKKRKEKKKERRKLAMYPKFAISSFQFHSLKYFGIISGTAWGSFGVGDHFGSRIISDRGSFQVLYSLFFIISIIHL